jgi:hypothetical protein
MELNAAVSAMACQMEALVAISKGLNAEQSRWRPTADSWSVLEVMCHLLDEEREDFRVRLDCILNRPGESWPPIDPQGWVSARQYNDRDLEETIEQLASERAKSLQWLSELDDEALATSAEAPWGDEINAGDMLAAWVAHDLLHLRQLVELCYGLRQKSAEPYSGDYAGDW